MNWFNRGLSRALARTRPVTVFRACPDRLSAAAARPAPWAKTRGRRHNFITLSVNGYVFYAAQGGFVRFEARFVDGVKGLERQERGPLLGLLLG